MKMRFALFTSLLAACGGNALDTSSLRLTADMAAPPDMVQLTTDGVPVLCFNGKGQNVSSPNFWGPGGYPLGLGFRHEFVAMGEPWTNGGYFEADGYGGGHRNLNSGLNGNFMLDQGTAAENILSYAADDSLPANTFSDIDASIQTDAYGKAVFVLRHNGIPVARTFIPDGATTTTAGAGAGTLDWGGSDHSNAIGCIYEARIWDTTSAHDTYPGQAFIPQRFFDDLGPNYEPVDFLMTFDRPQLGIYADLSSGYDSGGEQPRRMKHNGIPGFGNHYDDGYWLSPVNVAELPTVRIVKNAPFDAHYNENDPTLLANLKRGCTPSTWPTGTKLGDNFCRADQEFFHRNTPDIGSLEYSSIGALQRWHSGYPGGQSGTIPTPNYPVFPAASDGGVQKASIGLYNRSPIPLDAYPTVMWVSNNSGDATVSVDRRRPQGTSTDASVALAFRVVDESHMWACFYQRFQIGNGDVLDDSIYLWRWDAAGTGTLVSSAHMPDELQAFRTLSVTTVGNNIGCYAGQTLLVSTTDSTYATATGFGIYWPENSALSRRFNWNLR